MPEEKKYEVDFMRMHESGHINTIQILTGCEDEEILKHAPARDIWRTRDYIDTFHKLGFSTNPRFIKFDPETKYPVMMRYYRKDIKDRYWYSWVYYNGLIYFGQNIQCDFDEWVQANKEIVRVTSMLQVWI